MLVFIFEILLWNSVDFWFVPSFIMETIFKILEDKDYILFIILFLMPSIWLDSDYVSNEY